MQGLFVYLIILVIGLALRSAKNTKKPNKGTAQNGQPYTPAATKTAQPVRRTPTQEELKKAVSALLQEQGRRAAKPVPAKPTVAPLAPQEDEGFYQGQSFGDEGIDPCHDEMYEHRTDSAEPAAAAPVPAAFNLRFSPDSVLNGVIMSEVLARRN